MPSRTIRRTPRRPRQRSDLGLFLAVICGLVLLVTWDVAGPVAALLLVGLVAAVYAVRLARQRSSAAPSAIDSSLA